MAAYIEEAIYQQVAGVGGQFTTTRGPAIASASTIAPTYQITHVTGTATVNTISVPWPGFTGTLTLIPDGAFVLGTSGNISLPAAYQTVVGVPVYVTFDGSSWFLAGSGAAPIGVLAPWSEGYASIAGSVIGIGTLDVTPLAMKAPGTFNSVYVGLSNNYSATNAGSSNAQSLSCTLGVYTRTGSSLSLASSGSVSTAYTVTGSSSSASYHGLKFLPVPAVISMSPGNYYYGYIYSSASAGHAIMGALSNAVISYAGAESAALGIYGSNTAASYAPVLGKGQVSVCTAALPASIGFSDMITAGQTGQPVINFQAFTV